MMSDLQGVQRFRGLPWGQSFHWDPERTQRLVSKHVRTSPQLLMFTGSRGECTNLRSGATSGSRNTGGTSVSLTTVISRLSLGTGLTVSTLRTEDNQTRWNFKLKHSSRCEDILEEMTYRRSSESSGSGGSRLSTLTLKRKKKSQSLIQAARELSLCSQHR